MESNIYRNLFSQIKERISNPEQISDDTYRKPATIYPSVTIKEIEIAESMLGFELPPLFRKLLTEIGNGGFGPTYGLLGIMNGAEDNGSNIIDLYKVFRKSNYFTPVSQWPERLLPICHFGCGMYACLDCTYPDAPVIWYEPNPREKGDPLNPFLIPIAKSFEEWLWFWFKQLSSIYKALMNIATSDNG